jgi:hypothetical protein
MPVTDPTLPEGDLTPTPIVVNGSVNQVQLQAEFRKFCLAVGPVLGVLGATGWGQKIGLANWAAAGLTYAGPICAAIAWVWGFYETRKNAKKIVTLANYVGDDIAVTK